jgi:hypothetical protein
MKYKISLLSIAMAVIVLGSMVAVAGVSTAQSATVGSTCVANVAAATDGTATLFVAQGAQNSPHPGTTYNLYVATAAAGGAPGAWTAINGFGTNPCVVSTASGAFSIFWNDNGALMEATGTGITASAHGTWTAQTGAGMLPTTPSLASGMGPTATQTGTQTDIFYVATGGALMEWSQSGSSAWPTTLGGNVLASPAASTTLNGAGIVVIVKGTDGIYERVYEMGAWGPWIKLHDGAIGLGASLVRTPATSQMYLFVAGTNSHLYVLYSANDGTTWSTLSTATHTTQNLDWINLGGVCYSAPATTGTATLTTAYVVGGDCRIWVFTVGLSLIGNVPPVVTGTWSPSSFAGP